MKTMDAKRIALVKKKFTVLRDEIAFLRDRFPTSPHEPGTTPTFEQHFENVIVCAIRLLLNLKNNGEKIGVDPALQTLEKMANVALQDLLSDETILAEIESAEPSAKKTT